jgi:hypothetical protein
MGCAIGQSTIFGPGSKNIKFYVNDLIAVDGPNTVERQILGNLRFPYNQILRGRIILKAGQINYLLNNLGLGDNSTLLSLAVTYDPKSVHEEDNYIMWSFYDNLVNSYPISYMLLLSGNSTNRVKQIYLTNPNPNYDVNIDVLVGNIDNTYNFFNDTLNQTGTTFVNLTYTSIQSYIIGESIKIIDSNSNPLIYISLSNISSIYISGQILTIDQTSTPSIFLQFTTINDANQAFSILNYVISNPNVDIGTLGMDTQPPTIYWFSTVGNSASNDYIYLNGSSNSVPYSTLDGNTFSTSISLSTYGGTNSTIDKTSLNQLLINNVVDNRDGTINLTASNINLTYNSLSVNSITQSGTYSMTLNVSDIAGNAISGTTLTLTIF